jgi:hypothetical protein
MIYRRELRTHHSEAAQLITRATSHGVALDIRDFRVADGTLTLDGVPAGQWVAAMTGDNTLASVHMDEMGV